jgi:hypothetical protein
MYLEENDLFQNENRYLFQKCCGLESLSIMNLGRTYLDNKDDLDLFGDNKDNDEDEEWIHEMISQSTIMKFVRFTPTLRWL